MALKNETWNENLAEHLHLLLLGGKRERETCWRTFVDASNDDKTALEIIQVKAKEESASVRPSDV